MAAQWQQLEIVLNGLMGRYKERVPDVAAIMNAMVADNIIENETAIENDHIAFRTIGTKHLGITSLEKIFLHLGYKKMDYYYFAEKKLDAYWYAPPAPQYPRIFISELRVVDFPLPIQQLIHSYTSEVVTDPVSMIDLNDAAAIDGFLHSGLWRTPTWTDFEALTAVSEYAAWTIYNRYYLNHFTISVHQLKEGYHTIALFNQFLEEKGFVLNNSNGKIKESPDGALLQSSTVAEMIQAPFAEGDIHSISGSYVEFAERRVLDAFKHLPPDQVKREHRREGFEAKNADKIFESTYSTQTGRK